MPFSPVVCGLGDQQPKRYDSFDNTTIFEPTMVLADFVTLTSSACTKSNFSAKHTSTCALTFTAIKPINNI